MRSIVKFGRSLFTLGVGIYLSFLGHRIGNTVIQQAASYPLNKGACALTQEYQNDLDGLMDGRDFPSEQNNIIAGLSELEIIDFNDNSTGIESLRWDMSGLFGWEDIHRMHARHTGSLLGAEHIVQLDGRSMQVGPDTINADQNIRIINRSLSSNTLSQNTGDFVVELGPEVVTKWRKDYENIALITSAGNDGAGATATGRQKFYPYVFGTFFTTGALAGRSDGSLWIAAYTNGTYGIPTLWAPDFIAGENPFSYCQPQKGTSSAAPVATGVVLEIVERFPEHVWMLPWALELTGTPLQEVLSENDPLRADPRYNGFVPNPVAAAQLIQRTIDLGIANRESYLYERAYGQSIVANADGSVDVLIESAHGINPSSLIIGYDLPTQQDFTLHLYAPGQETPSLLRTPGLLNARDESTYSSDIIGKLRYALSAPVPINTSALRVGHPDIPHQPGIWRLRFTPAEQGAALPITTDNVFIDFEGFSFAHPLGSVTAPEQLGVSAQHNPLVDLWREYIKDYGAETGQDNPHTMQDITSWLALTGGLATQILCQNLYTAFVRQRNTKER